MSEDIQSVAVIGAGVIGASWASLFLSHGLDVHVVDPRPGTEDELRAYIDEAWKHLAELRKIPENRLRYPVGITLVLRRCQDQLVSCRNVGRTGSAPSANWWLRLRP